MKQETMKTILNQISKWAVGITMSIALVACNDMLDMPSKTAFEVDAVFTSSSRSELAVMGIYPYFKSKALVNYMTPDNDETYSNLSGNERAALSKFNFAAASTQMKPILENRYMAINNANICIHGIEQSGNMENDNADSQKFKALYGEALALRAWAYFDLIRFYGDVPFTLNPTTVGEDYNLGRTSRDTIYDKILSDLELAAEYVPWQSEVSYHDRITKAAVYGFISRIALHAAGYSLRWDLETYDSSTLKMDRRDDPNRIKELYQMARNACLKVIEKEGNEVGLSADYKSLFVDVHNGQYNKETIFELGNYGTSANDEIGYSMGLSVGSGTPNNYMPSGTLVRIVPSFYYSFNEKDTRRDVTCASFQVTKTTGVFELVDMSNIACGKWRKIWQKTQGPESGLTNINWIMMRYADILLMFAEADNELTTTPSTEAKDALKKVRNRAFAVADRQTQVEDYVNALTTKESFFNAIVNERSWELASESNIRRTDLIRWNRLASTIADTRAKLNTIYLNKLNPYTNEVIPMYRIYKKEVFALGSEPLAVSFTNSATNTVTTGYTAFTYFNDANMKKFVAQYAQYFEANKCELMPMNQSLIDTNSALKGSQHPGFK